MNPLQPSRPTFAEIVLGNLSYNLKSIREFLGSSVEVMAVVKANAYGHGSLACSRRLSLDGVRWFAVAMLEEAIELRSSLPDANILCFGGVWRGQEERIVGERITPVIFDLDAAESINNAASASETIAPVHVKIDTGMHRVGVPAHASAEFARKLAGLRHLRVEGLLTHFAAADDLSESEFTDMQVSSFHHAVEAFRACGHQPTILDLANSPGAIAHPESRGNMVRIGGILYGLGGDVLPKGVPTPDLRPVMSWRTKVAMVKSVAAGMSIGYARTFVTERDSLIGTLPVGYDDGYRRGLSNVGNVIVKGTLAPVVGRVSMDWITVDLTEIPDVQAGETVTLIGRDGGCEITAEEVASQLGTISYEVTCGISARVPRIVKAE